jgi:hypothetical protein
MKFCVECSPALEVHFWVLLKNFPFEVLKSCTPTIHFLMVELLADN